MAEQSTLPAQVPISVTNESVRVTIAGQLAIVLLYMIKHNDVISCNILFQCCVKFSVKIKFS